MVHTFDYNIDTQEEGKTIQAFLHEKGYSRAILVHLKKTPESIRLNGSWEYMHTRLRTGDTLRIILTESEASTDIVPTPMPLDICYEDEDILVINKPADMPVHPSRRHPTHTLANAVCAYFKEQGISYTFRCVNRLDRDTTGLVILAKHALSSAILNQAIREREVHREYLALADGCVPEKGTISAPIGRKNPLSTMRVIDNEHGELAITHYQRLSYENGCSLLSLRLETGRTHQIRVHMKHLGYPLIGDTLYHPEYNGHTGDHKIKRQALHSYRLQFKHPITGIPMDFIAPLPADMAALVSQVPSVHTESDLSGAFHG